MKNKNFEDIISRQPIEPRKPVEIRIVEDNGDLGLAIDGTSSFCVIVNDELFTGFRVNAMHGIDQISVRAADAIITKIKWMQTL